MHDLEPFDRWLYLYDQNLDRSSPFGGQDLPELGFHRLYDHLIHPDWDSIGSDTLYVKILYIHEALAFAVIELIGEWNDTIGNDIMWLKRELIDSLLPRGIQKFIVMGDNVLNYHGEEDAYYEEWSDDCPQGWVVGMGFRPHITEEWQRLGLGRFMYFGDDWSDDRWRTRHPLQLYWAISERLHPGLAIPSEIPLLR